MRPETALRTRLYLKAGAAAEERRMWTAEMLHVSQKMDMAR